MLNNIDVPAPFKYVISRSLFSHNISSLDDAIQLINIQTARDLIQNFPDNEEFPQFLNGARSLLAKESVIFKGFIFDNVGKSRIRLRTTLKLNDEFLG